jgi:hypothetical protein
MFGQLAGAPADVNVTSCPPPPQTQITVSPAEIVTEFGEKYVPGPTEICVALLALVDVGVSLHAAPAPITTASTAT